MRSSVSGAATSSPSSAAPIGGATCAFGRANAPRDRSSSISSSSHSPASIPFFFGFSFFSARARASSSRRASSASRSRCFAAPPRRCSASSFIPCFCDFAFASAPRDAPRRGFGADAAFIARVCSRIFSTSARPPAIGRSARVVAFTASSCSSA